MRFGRNPKGLKKEFMLAHQFQKTLRGDVSTISKVLVNAMLKEGKVKTSKIKFKSLKNNRRI